MSNRDKRNHLVEGGHSLPPMQSHEMPHSNQEQEAPKKERHFQQDKTSTNPDIALAEASTSRRTTLTGQDDEQEDEDPDPDDDKVHDGTGRVPPQGSTIAVPKLKLRLNHRSSSLPISPNKKHRSPRKKNLPKIPFATAQPYTPLQTDDSSDEAPLAASSRAHSLTPAKPNSTRLQNASDTDFDLDMSEAIFGHNLADSSQVMITWTDHEDDSVSETDALQFHVEEQDLEELLAWGNGEVKLHGMPEVAHQDFWPSHGAGHFLELELDNTSSEDDGSHSDDSSMDSAEEEEQMLAVRGLCAFGSDSEGETTDSIDDTDQDGLVRFGIEHSGSPIRRVKRPPPPAEPKLPVMGSFKPVSTTESAIVEAAEPTKAPIMSPFSARKVRLPRLKAASESTPSRKRTASIASSSQQSTQSAPSQIEQHSCTSPSPISDIPEEDEEEVFMDLDLDDILQSFEMDADSDEPELTDLEALTNGGSMSDLSRWNRVPIGAYRSSRSPHKAGGEALPAMRHGSVGISDAPIYFPVANLLSTRDTITLRVPWLYGRKRKITRQEAIGLSPIMCPIRPVPSSMKSRKQKRAERKAAKKSHLVSPSQLTEASTSTFARAPLEKTGTDIMDHEVPPLALPGASEPIPTAHIEPPVNLLPVPTLPSAECLPLDSPLFSAVRTRPTPHIFVEP